MNPQLLKCVCCPETRQPLRMAEPELVATLNRQIAAGTLRNRSDQLIRDKLDAGLVRSDGLLLYPIRQNIPVMLGDEGISLRG